MMNIGYKVLLALTLWTMITEAFPKCHQRTNCHLSRYKSLPPGYLEAFKKAKDKFEDIMLLSDQKCSTRIFHRNRKLKQLSVHDRVILVETKMNFTINVLENVEDPSLSELLSKPLDILMQIREGLMNCTGQTHSHSSRLNNWLQNFHESNEKETPGCLEASVILNLFRLLNEDLRYIAHMEFCV